MMIKIDDNRKISTIQDEFNSIFPYLRLEFFTKSYVSGGTFSKKFIKQNNKTIGECRIKHNRGNMNITCEMTVVDLEKGFNDIYGLGVEVFRQSGKVWLETTVTDCWTLKEQNSQGESLSKVVA